MSERRPDPERFKRQEDVEGHRMRGPVEGEYLNPGLDDASEDEAGRQR